MIEGKITAGRPRNSYIEQINSDVEVNTYKQPSRARDFMHLHIS